jgi:hypothetical protein
MRKKMILWPLALTFVMIFSAHMGESQSGSKVVELTLAFADAEWDGKTIPKGQQCEEYDGIRL